MGSVAQCFDNVIPRSACKPAGHFPAVKGNRCRRPDAVGTMPSMSDRDNAVALALLRRLVADGTAKRLREEAHLSLADVGRACGTDAATVWHWERGRRPSAALAMRYADLLGELADVGVAV